jgi:hypothetical protein
MNDNSIENRMLKCVVDIYGEYLNDEELDDLYIKILNNLKKFYIKSY